MTIGKYKAIKRKSILTIEITYMQIAYISRHACTSVGKCSRSTLVGVTNIIIQSSINERENLIR